jgi:hypothetical protein
MKKFATAIVFCLLSSVPCAWAQSAQSILGTWTTQHRMTGHQTFGVSIATFYPDGTFKLITRVNIGQMECVGRYEFDGRSLHYVMDDYDPKDVGLDPGPAYHNPCTETVEFDEAHNQMYLNGSWWNHQPAEIP